MKRCNFAAWLVLAMPVLASAATFTVDTTIDAVDANPGDGVCADAQGNCPLRAAIMEANALAGSDDIVFDNLATSPDVYTLTIPGPNEDAAAEGDLDITEDVLLSLTITGNGQTETIIDAGGDLGVGDRVFDIGFGGVIIEGVTITGGRAPRGADGSSTIDGGNGGDGGGIRSRGSLSLIDSTVRGNRSGDGGLGRNGGIGGRGGGISNSFFLELMNSTVSGNITGDGGIAVRDGGNSGDGGGIFTEGIARLTNSLVDNNRIGLPGFGFDDDGAGGDGGGIYNRLGTLELFGTTVSNNQAGVMGAKNGESGDGGGIFNLGTATLTDSTVRGNSTRDAVSSDDSAGNGGGIFNRFDGMLTLTNSIVSENRTGNGVESDGSSSSGGDGGGLYIDSQSTVTITDSTVSENVTGTGALGDPGGDGGGLFITGRDNTPVDVTIDRSRVTANRTGDGGTSNDFINTGGNGGDGGGLYISVGSFSSIQILDSTVSDNATGDGGTSNSDMGGEGGNGGGLYIFGSELVEVINTTVSGNTTGNGGNDNDGGDGGGFFVFGIVLVGIPLFEASLVRITNSTLSGNATGNGTERGGDGGGIFLDGDSTVELTNTTLTANSVGSGGASGGTDGRGGGIFTLQPLSVVTIANTLIGGNIANAAADGFDCFGTLESLDFNLIQFVGGANACDVVGPLTNNITGLDPLLGPLQNNGGPTETHAPNINSPAIDAGDSFAVFVDQRGEIRPFDLLAFDGPGDESDIGAVELITPAPTASCQSIVAALVNGTVTVGVNEIDNGSAAGVGQSILAIEIAPGDQAADCATATFDPSVDLGCADVGDRTVTLRVTQTDGQTACCTATVTVQDNVAPIAVCRDVTVQLDANGNASITAADVDGGSSDDCDIASLDVSESDFTCADVGDNTVTLTVTDIGGNIDTCTATVTVEDNTAPAAICQDVTVQLDGNGEASITAGDIDNGSNDACGLASLSASPANFTCADVGANTVTLTVTDNNGNQSNCTATVTVEDNVAPAALCQDVTVQLDANGQASVNPLDADNGSNDACGIASLTVSRANFTCADVGANTVTLTVTDNNGNQSNCTATVTVEDNIAPAAFCQDVTVQLDGNGEASITAVDIDNGSNDACGIASLSVSPSLLTCADVPARTVTLTVTDNNGIQSTCDATVTVEDVEPPIAVCMDAAVTVNPTGPTPIAGEDIDGGSTDNCEIVTRTVAPNDFTCADTDVPQTVTLTVADASGNEDSCTATITISGCDDGDACTREACVAGVCEITPLFLIPEADGGCDDGDPCTLDICDRLDGAQKCDNHFLIGDDDDFDGFPNHCDNCIFVANPLQTDTDQDGFGDACDGDKIGDNCFVDAADMAALIGAFGTTDAECDLNGDGAVGMADLAILLRLFGRPPGPSALATCP